MIKQYFIDGNNLIHKDSELKIIQKTNPQNSRMRLAHKISRFISQSKVKAVIIFDGFQNDLIIAKGVKIIYSENRKADCVIKDEIDFLKTRHTTAVISSDHEVLDYAKKSSCKTIKSEDFIKIMQPKNKELDEAEIQKSIDDDEMLELFLK